MIKGIGLPRTSYGLWGQLVVESSSQSMSSSGVEVLLVMEVLPAMETLSAMEALPVRKVLPVMEADVLIG